MKAYVIWDTECEEGYQELVYATTAKEARNTGLGELPYAEFINVRVKRASYMDDTEYLSEADRIIRLIEHGWWYEVEGQRYDEDNLDAFREGVQNGTLQLEGGD